MRGARVTLFICANSTDDFIDAQSVHDTKLRSSCEVTQKLIISDTLEHTRTFCYIIGIDLVTALDFSDSTSEKIIWQGFQTTGNFGRNKTVC